MKWGLNETIASINLKIKIINNIYRKRIILRKMKSIKLRLNLESI